VLGKQCPRCKQTKPLSEFNVERSKPDGVQSRCRDCTKEVNNDLYRNGDRKRQVRDAVARARQRNAEYLYQYLLDHPCVDCGETDPVVLQFDHVSDKVLNISALMAYSLDRIKQELARCEVRCANCHVRITARRHGGWWRTRLARFG
jgi:hypothetical protein